MSDGPLFMGPPQVPAIDLARDPNMPSKREQLRVLCLQLATQAVLTVSGHGDGGQAVAPDQVGTRIVGAAEAMEKYLTR